MNRLLDKMVSLKSEGVAKENEAIVDSESIKSAHPSSVKGIDGAKKTKGIKRHILVNGMGFSLRHHNHESEYAR